MLKESKADIFVDPVLHTACALDIKHHCAAIPPGKGRREYTRTAALLKKKFGGGGSPGAVPVEIVSCVVEHNLTSLASNVLKHGLHESKSRPFFGIKIPELDLSSLYLIIY